MSIIMERLSTGVYVVEKSKSVTNPLPSGDNAMYRIDKNKTENGF